MLEKYDRGLVKNMIIRNSNPTQEMDISIMRIILLYFLYLRKLNEDNVLISLIFGFNRILC